MSIYMQSAVYTHVPYVFPIFNVNTRSRPSKFHLFEDLANIYTY